MTNLIWHIEKRKLKDLIPWNKNPRKISDAHLEKLKERIKQRGFHDVLKIDENNVVLSGNQRLKVLTELGYKEVECKVPSRAMTDEEKDKVGLESNINDGENDFDLLANFDIDLLKDVGFSAIDLNIVSYNDKNKEINVSDFADIMFIKLEYTEADYKKVKNQLSKIANTPEQAVWKLLGNE